MNTINICIGHKNFPIKFVKYIDLFIAPVISINYPRLAYVPDNINGENGHALSEYSQLLWLYKNIDSIAKDKSFVRIFHYRRFISVYRYENSITALNSPWTQIITETNLNNCIDDFKRNNSNELYNTRVKFNSNLLNLYSETHVLEDLLLFTNFLLDQKIFDKKLALDFLNSEYLIPACNIGLFSITNFKKIYSILEKAANFIYSSSFNLRTGYQRRSLGFLLERLHSFLILKYMQDNLIESNFGVNYLISNEHSVTLTSDRVE